MLAVVPLVLLPLGAVTACGGEGATTDCSLNACTVTFDRGVEASASILGVKAELVRVQGDNVTLRIGGQQITVPVNSEQEAEGLNVSVQSVTQDKVVVKISGGGEGGG
jgi:hypothetical protein